MAAESGIYRCAHRCSELAMLRIAQYSLKRRTQMATIRCGRSQQSVALLILVLGFGGCLWAQSSPITVILTGQSMIRSDMRETAPAAVPIIQSLLQGGDVTFGEFEGTVAEPGQPNESTPRAGPGFLAPPEALDALKAFGFNLLALSNNHSGDLKIPGVKTHCARPTAWVWCMRGSGTRSRKRWHRGTYTLQKAPSRWWLSHPG